MRKLIATAIVTTLVVLALLWAGAVAVARSGTVDVAATADFLPGAEWFFSTLKRRSVAEHARQAVERGDIQPPAEVGDDMLLHGASHYRSMCVVCHGAPGVPRGEFGQGLRPHPPELDRVAREWSREEIYWVLDNGLRHTGMPAFGKTHSSEELWGLTAFVERLDRMTPEEYRQRTSGVAAGGDGHGHGEESGHGHGGDSGGGAASPAGTAADTGQPAAAGEGDGHTDHDHSGHEH